jgi:Ni/Fe-hydrogenase subunit HybB-like protein
VVREDALLQQKAVYLNVPFFIARAVLYFAVWITVAQRLTRWSGEQDQTRADRTLVERLQTLSAPGLVLYGLTVTFSSIDWVMSVEPKWYSSIYGMIFMVSHGLTGLAFVIGAVYFLSRREPLAKVRLPWVLQDLGNLLLALVMLWAYTSFSQFLIIWIENLRHEIPWYLHRLAGGWGVIAVLLVVLQFALPFLLLLSRSVKRKTGALFVVAVLIAAMHLMEMWWFIAPTFHPEGFALHWTTVLAPLGIGGLWLGAFLGQLRRRPLLPVGDPRFMAIVDEHGLAKNG